jgi:ABC-type antimicrobial peptide transport system permease subunit
VGRGVFYCYHFILTSRHSIEQNGKIMLGILSTILLMTMIKVTAQEKFSSTRSEIIAQNGMAALILALITMAYQSIRASRANPVDSLRNE